MNSIIFQDNQFNNLRRNLFLAAPNEAAAILVAGYSKVSGATRLLVREILAVPSEAYLIQEKTRLSISPMFLAPIIKRARTDGWSLVLTHSHPFGSPVTFSQVDDEGEDILMPSIFQRAPSRPHGTLVVGSDSFDARVWSDLHTEQPVSTVIEVGNVRRIHAKEHDTSDVHPQFDRNVRAFGAHGQKVLRRLHIGIVGLGGTGSIVAEQLAYLGIGRMTLLDPDVVDETNLNRVVGSTRQDIGVPKVEVAAEHCQRIRREIKVEPIRGSVTQARDARVLLECDLIVCCTDSHGSRAVLNQIAYQYLIPTVDLGVRIDAESERVQNVTGRIQLLAPGLPCLLCQKLLDPEEIRRDLLSDEERRRDPYIIGSHEPQPAVISINGTVASLAVSMILAVMAGMPGLARHQIYRGIDGVVRRVEGRSDEVCVVCSQKGALGRGDLWPLPWRMA